MVLTYNYADLQNIKEKLQNTKNLDKVSINKYIKMYEETLDFMYKNNLIPEKSRLNIEEELNNFKNTLLFNYNYNNN